MTIQLHFATNPAIDEFLGAAGRYFFNGSVAEARAHLGEFDDAETGFILAYDGNDPVATVTIRWKSNYPPFKIEGIPLIQNIEIRYDLRGAGYGMRVMEAVENHIATRSPKVGICVGLFDAYGPAQRLYARRGYIPDGRGACTGTIPLKRGDTITIGDEHLIWMVKILSG